MEYKGKGSASKRASEIRNIYELAAPILGTVNTTPAIQFMKDVREMVRLAVEKSGEKMRLDHTS